MNEIEKSRLEAMGLLATGLVHDFNNLLSIIEGYAYILQQQIGDNARVRDKLDHILIATQRGAEITQAMAGFAVSEEMQPQCNLVAAVIEAKPLLRILFGSRIDLVLHLPEEAIIVPVSADHIAECVVRLASEAKRTISATGSVTLKVMADADQAKIMMSHTESEVSFDRVVIKEQDPLKDKTVLIVDDEEALLPVLEHQLQSMGLKVLKAANADKALLLQKDYPDIIDFLLTDIVMPDVDGVQLAEMITDGHPRMGVVYMTGYASRLSGIDIPDDSLVVPKPLRTDKLSDAFQKALEKVQDA